MKRNVLRGPKELSLPSPEDYDCWITIPRK